MKKGKFITKRTKIISDMLDNPDKQGIFETTKAYALLDDLYDDTLAEILNFCKINFEIKPSEAQKLFYGTKELEK